MQCHCSSFSLRHQSIMRFKIFIADESDPFLVILFFSSTSRILGSPLHNNIYLVLLWNAVRWHFRVNRFVKTILPTLNHLKLKKMFLFLDIVVCFLFIWRSRCELGQVPCDPETSECTKSRNMVYNASSIIIIMICEPYSNID
jgi:hypothetical protein